MRFENKSKAVNIKITPKYQRDMSSISNSNYVWLYNVLIENISNRSFKILTRHWCIIDENGVTQQISGDGVLGNQPIIEPGFCYEYCSHVSLDRPSGMMMGAYEVLDVENGEIHNVKIPTFSLDRPNEKFLQN